MTLINATTQRNYFGMIFLVYSYMNTISACCIYNALISKFCAPVASLYQMRLLQKKVIYFGINKKKGIEGAKKRIQNNFFILSRLMLF